MTFSVPWQHTTISNIPKQVTVVWVAPDRVHYLLKGDTIIRETSIERFLDILNGRK